MKNELHVVPFSHLDLFWTGTREECLSRGNFIISKALELLEKYEDFRYLVETVNFLEQYLDCYPDELERVKKLAQSGRLELGPLWTGIYLNLPGGETICRNILYAKSYVNEKLECDPLVAHFGDLPGYTPQFPQIAKLAGVRNVLMSRGGPASIPLFHWEALNGDKVLSYYVKQGYPLYAMKSDWHKSYMEMSSGSLNDFIAAKLDGSTNPELIHWGSDLYAPHENIITNVRQWNQDHDVQLKFSTLEEYFNIVADVKNIPTLKGELPSAWPNIESSWPDIWPLDMPCEAALQMAEFLSSYCLLHGWSDYPQNELEAAWKSLLDGMDHNQNGQGGELADKDKLQLKLFSLYTAEKIIDKASWRLASRIPVPDNKSFPVVVFNSMSWRRSHVVSGPAAIFGEVRSCDIAEFDAGLKLIDDAGNTVPYVTLSRHEGLSVTQEIAFHAEVPAAGYRAYYIVPGKNPVDDDATCDICLDSNIDNDPTQKLTYSTVRQVRKGPRRSQGTNIYENDFFKLSVDTITGTLAVYDKSNGELLFDKLEIVGIEERRGNYISDMKPSGRIFPALIDNIETIDNNSVWCRIRISGSVYSMPFSQVVTLYRDVPEISLENEIDWQEPRWVRLEQLFTYSGDDASVCYGVPFGQVKYPETLSGAATQEWDEISDEERNKLRLCRHWIDIGDETSGATIAADHRMWELEGSTLRSYMLRGCGYCFGISRTPDGELKNIPRPPAGKYRFSYTIKPRHKSLSRSNSYRSGWELNHPCKVTAVCGTNSKATLPVCDGLLDFTETSMVTTATKKAEHSDGIVIRAFEASGKSTQLPFPDISGYSIYEANILEHRQQDLNGSVSPFEIKTLIVEKE